MPHQRPKYMSDPTPEKQCHNTCQVKGQVKAPVFSGTSSPTVISNREPLWACELNSCQYFRIALLGRAAWQNLRSPTRSGIALLGTWQNLRSPTRSGIAWCFFNVFIVKYQYWNSQEAFEGIGSWIWQTIITFFFPGGGGRLLLLFFFSGVGGGLMIIFVFSFLVLSGIATNLVYGSFFVYWN